MSTRSGSADGTNESAEICGRALASSYDAVKAVNTGNFVWGVGLSPRGNDNPNAVSDSSTSPVQFLLDLGAWFRSFAVATGRTTPLMDGLDFHPYPIPQSLPFAQGYANSNDATVSNLARIYQAFYTGFAGTPQPTIGEQAGGGEPLSLNEAGIQTDSSGRSGYTGTESSATAAGGVVGQYATEAYQASWYQQMLNLLACDPNVRLVNIYHLIDEAGLAGWQSGLYYLDRTAKQSATTVHDWLAQTRGRCQGPTQVPGCPPASPRALPHRRSSPNTARPEPPRPRTRGNRRHGTRPHRDATNRPVRRRRSVLSSRTRPGNDRRRVVTWHRRLLLLFVLADGAGLGRATALWFRHGRGNACRHP